MCLGFILYYPRRQLADCRSLPAPATLMSALGVNEIYGQSFQKLASFLGDIGGKGGGGGGNSEASLTDLLNILASETGNELFLQAGGGRSHLGPVVEKPLTEEDLLNKPFYTVEGEDSHDPRSSLESIVPAGTDYR